MTRCKYDTESLFVAASIAQELPVKLTDNVDIAVSIKERPNVFFNLAD
jgi:hypothetical protein